MTGSFDRLSDNVDRQSIELITEDQVRSVFFFVARHYVRRAPKNYIQACIDVNYILEFSIISVFTLSKTVGIVNFANIHLIIAFRQLDTLR